MKASSALSMPDRYRCMSCNSSNSISSRRLSISTSKTARFSLSRPCAKAFSAPGMALSTPPVKASADRARPAPAAPPVRIGAWL
ncbi:MAG: hypothetical protein LBU06_05730 [Desulfovibrio sp.]|nr:hypothetical protein [Desulfovibrio sp.]